MFYVVVLLLSFDYGVNIFHGIGHFILLILYLAPCNLSTRLSVVFIGSQILLAPPNFCL